MKLFAPVLIVLMTAGCATGRTGPPEPDGAWLTGTWLMMSSKDDRDLTACASGLPISYASDGTYALFEEGGVWRLAGDRLTETATSVTDAGDPNEVQIGRPFVSRIRWINKDEFVKTTARGKMIFRRCPPP